ncbi:hypothetical protein P9112_009911 [Eukaryota sp. TZLM1-RC]
MSTSPATPTQVSTITSKPTLQPRDEDLKPTVCRPGKPFVETFLTLVQSYTGKKPPDELLSLCKQLKDVLSIHVYPVCLLYQQPSIYLLNTFQSEIYQLHHVDLQCPSKLCRCDDETNLVNEKELVEQFISDEEMRRYHKTMNAMTQESVYIKTDILAYVVKTMYEAISDTTVSLDVNQSEWTAIPQVDMWKSLCTYSKFIFLGVPRSVTVLEPNTGEPKEETETRKQRNSSLSVQYPVKRIKN